MKKQGVVKTRAHGPGLGSPYQPIIPPVRSSGELLKLRRLLSAWHYHVTVLPTICTVALCGSDLSLTSWQ